MASTSGDSSDITLAAYELHAEQYIARTSNIRSQLVDDLIALVPQDSSVLELGSGPGRDAAALEEAGLVVTRTDGAASFVRLFRSRGLEAHTLDVTADGFGGPFDAVLQTPCCCMWLVLVWGLDP